MQTPCVAFVDRTDNYDYIAGRRQDPSGPCQHSARIVLNGKKLCAAHAGKALELLARRTGGPISVHAELGDLRPTRATPLRTEVSLIGSRNSHDRPLRR